MKHGTATWSQALSSWIAFLYIIHEYKVLITLTHRWVAKCAYRDSIGERAHTRLLRHSLMLFRHHVCTLYTSDFGQVLRLYPFNFGGQLLKRSLLKIRTFCLVRTAFMIHSSLLDSFVCKPAKNGIAY